MATSKLVLDYNELRAQRGRIERQMEEIRNNLHTEINNYVKQSSATEFTTSDIKALSGDIFNGKYIAKNDYKMGLSLRGKRRVTTTYAKINPDGTVDMNHTINHSVYTNIYHVMGC